MSKIQKINRKQYYNIDATISRDDIFAILDSVDSENEEDIENLMNDSDTEFVVVTEEEEEKINIDGNVTQEQGSILIPEANVHILSHSQDVDFNYNADDEVQIVGYLRNESPIVPEEDVENAKDAEVQLIASSETLAEKEIFILEANDNDLQHVNKKGQKKKSALNRNKPVDKKQSAKKKQPTSTEKPLEKKKPGKDTGPAENIEPSIKWSKRNTSGIAEPCNLEATFSHDVPENVTPFEIFQVVELDILVDLLVEQSNLYSHQCGRNFFTNDREMKAFIGVNYFMAINKLPNLQNYWDSDIFIGN